VARWGDPVCFRITDEALRQIVKGSVRRWRWYRCRPLLFLGILAWLGFWYWFGVVLVNSLPVR